MSATELILMIDVSDRRSLQSRRYADVFWILRAASSHIPTASRIAVGCFL